MSDGFGLGAATPIQRGIKRLRPRSRVTPSGIAARTEVAPIQPPTGALTAAPTARTPDIVQARVASEQRQSLFAENPLQAIGLVLSNIAAGFEGRTLPTEEFARQRLAEQEMAERRLTLGINALSSFVDLSANLDEEGRTALAARFDKQFGDVLGQGTFAILAQRPSVDLQDVADTFARISPDVLARFVRTTDDFEDLRSNPQQIELLREMSNRGSLQTAERKFGAAIQTVTEALSPEEIETVRGQTFDFQFIRDNAEAAGLEPYEVAALEANEQALTQMFAKIGLSYVPSELQAKIVEKRALAEPDIATKEVEENGNRVIVGFDKDSGKETFRLPIGDVEREFKGDEFDRAVRILATGGDISGFSSATRKILSGVDQSQAAQIEAMRRGGGIQITTSPDGTQTISIGGPAGVAGERRREVLEAQEEFEKGRKVPAAVLALADLIPGSTFLDLENQNVSVPSEPEIKELRAVKTSAQAIIREGTTIRTLIEGRADLLSLPGAALSAIDRLTSNIAGSFQAFGVDVTASRDPETYANVFERIAVERGDVRSAMLALAFAVARNREPGKLTDQDIIFAIETLGGESANPKVFVRKLDGAIVRADARFADRVAAAYNKRPFTLRLNDEDRRLLGIPPEGADDETLKRLFEEMSSDDVRGLSDQAIFFLREIARAGRI